jgi:hypothetical protein
VLADTTIQEALDLYGQDGSANVYVGTDRPDAPHISRVEVDAQALRAGHLRLEVHFRSPHPLDPVVGVVVATGQGNPVFGSNPLLHADGYDHAPLRSGVAVLSVPDLPLHSGIYKASVWLHDRQGTLHEKKTDAVTFDFVAREALPSNLLTSVIGPLRPAASWTLAPAEELSVVRNGVG